ncbi:hypothetical protein [Streptomyces uncialis]|uniref:hypothetical protein n=1 Tax=Streptomyces uncialis TaxID=1048205 RepID=UPI0033D711F4
MKTTMLLRNTANPRRTTLAHVDDVAEFRGAGEALVHSLDLPAQTANPRRTILVNPPEPFVPAPA